MKHSFIDMFGSLGLQIGFISILSFNAVLATFGLVGNGLFIWYRLYKEMQNNDKKKES
jgi:hypothetical protein